MKKILYVHYGDNCMRGSEVCLLNLMSNLNRQQFTPVLWTNNPLLHERASAQGITSTLGQFGILFGWKGQRASLTHFITQIRQGISIIRENKISLVHANSGAPCQWMWLAARICRVPMLTQLHSGYTLRDRLRLFLHLSPQLVSVSQAVSNNLLDEGFPRQRLQVVYNGIDIQALQKQAAIDVRHKLGLPSDSKVIASVGALIRTKGMDRIINAIARLSGTHPDLHLVLIGSGPEKAALQAHAQQLGVAERVHLVGQQSEVCGWLQGVDLFVSGARDEAFGLVLAEAAVAGLPVVAPAVGGIPEVLQHQDSALLYDSRYPEQMSQHITSLLRDKSLAKQLEIRAKQRVLHHFSLQANSNRMLLLYTELLRSQAWRVPRPELISSLKPLKALTPFHLFS